jgi:hypothetical protein
VASKKRAAPPLWDWVLIVLVALGLIQASQIVAWTYDQAVSYVANDIRAKLDGGRAITTCGFESCVTYWHKED